jgi:hypothetical protein
VVRRGFLLSLALASACTAFGSSSEPGAVTNSTRDGSTDADETPSDASGEGPTSNLNDAEPTSPQPHIVFVTSGTFTGADVGDYKCADAVMNSPLQGRTFKAWLSYPDAGAKTRLANYGPWVLMNDGGEVAHARDNLLPTIETPIVVDENGHAITDDYAVWTGTDPDGIAKNTCNSWKDSTMTGSIGQALSNDGDWTFHGLSEPCATNHHLYCFEQPPDAGP